MTRMKVERRLADGPDEKARRNLILFVDIDLCSTDGVVVITRCRAGERRGTAPGSGEIAGVFIDPQTGKTAPLAVKETPGAGPGGSQSERGHKNSPLSLTLAFPDGLQSPLDETVLPFPASREAFFARMERPGPLAPPDDRADRARMVDTITGGSLSCGDLFIDFDTYEVMVRGRKVDFPHMTMRLLFFLARHPGRVYTREQLLDHVWGCNVYVSPRNVDVHVSRIRRAIEKDLSKPAYITSVVGVGYKFVGPGL